MRRIGFRSSFVDSAPASIGSARQLLVPGECLWIPDSTFIRRAERRNKGYHETPGTDSF